MATKRSIFISPNNVRSLASFIDSSAIIDSTTIRFGTGSDYEDLLRVPLTVPGEMAQHSVIRITVGTHPPEADNDPGIGISDGSNSNEFYIVHDGSSTSHYRPCYTWKNGEMEGKSEVAYSDPGHGKFTIIFDPKNHFGTCASNNGYEISATFDKQIDINKALDFVVTRDNAGEEYVFHYFMVEFL